MDTPAYITIERAVKSYLNEKGDYSMENLFRYIQIVLEGYTHLNIHHVITLKTAIITVNDKNLVKYPFDMVDYWTVNLIMEGKKWEISRNTDISIADNEVCGIETGNADLLNPIEDPDYQDYTQGGTWNIGKVRFDDKRRLMFFEGDMMGREIYLEYISTGISMSKKTYVPIELLPTLKAYLNWIITERSKVSLAERERSRGLYVLALSEWNQQRNAFTLQEALDAIRSGYTAGPKR